MSKGSNVYMKLFMGDYLADTHHLTVTEHGAYLLMLIHYYRTQKPLPDDDTQLQQISHLRGKLWQEKKPILAKFFVIKDGFWRQKRADEEIAKAVETYETKINNAKSKKSLNQVSGNPQTGFSTSTKNVQPTEKSGNDTSGRSAVASQSTSTSDGISPSSNISLNNNNNLNADVDVFEGDITDRKFVREKAIRLAGNSPNCYITMGIVDQWQDAGCDPILDIFPVIKANMERRKGNPPNSMSYFSQAVINAKALRLKQIPSPKENHYAIAKSAKPNRYLDAMARTNF